MRSIPDSPTFTRRQANELGWSDSALARAVRSGRLLRLRRGHFAEPNTATREAAAIAAVRACAASVICDRSGLLLHGVALVGPHPHQPELTVPPLGRVDIPNAHVFRATLPPEHVVMIGDVPVTSVARTLVDVARHRPTATAVAAMDHALHEGLTTYAELAEVIRFSANWPRARRAVHALSCTDDRAESPLESVSRLVLRWLGLPVPDLQPVIVDRFGRPAGRLDFYWDEFGVAGEADGRSKYVNGDDVLYREKIRQEHMEDDGLHFVRWGWDQVVHRRSEFRARMTAAFERGAQRDRSGFTRLWSVRPTPTGNRTVKAATGGRLRACP